LIGTLAAAYAEAGQFKEASATAQRARDLARAAGQSEVAEKNRQLLELYQSGRPYRQPPPASGTAGPAQ
jgi:carotenoid cleavage dioxygenase-like enzyme